MPVGNHLLAVFENAFLKTVSVLNTDVSQLLKSGQIVDQRFLSRLRDELTQRMPPDTVESILAKLKDKHFGESIDIHDVIKVARSVLD